MSAKAAKDWMFSVYRSERLRLFLLISTLFVGSCLVFFLVNDREPLPLFLEMIYGAFGDFFSITETLVQAAPIMFTAMAVALPARLGLISVGGEGQMNVGAILGTGIVLAGMSLPASVLMPALLLGGLLGGAFWGIVPALMKVKFGVNETISTLLLNYVALSLVNFLVHGPWRNPASLGWPSTVNFPDAALLPTFFDSRMHIGLLIAVLFAVGLHWLVTRSRWGLELSVLQSNPRAGATAGLNYNKHVLIVLGIGGMLAGMAGIIEVSVIQGRLQSGISGTFGLTGFLVAWLAGQNFLRIIPFSILIGGLLASADSLQMFAQLPSASAIILQSFLFIIVLAATSWSGRKRAALLQ
jgi:ABC-type uncharacterized transport system permease subunit